MARNRTNIKASTPHEPSVRARGEPCIALDDLIGYNLRRAHGVQKQRFAAVFGPFGIRPVTLSALAVIHDHPSLKPGELGKRLNIKRANMVPLLAELGARGLIARRPCVTDRRAQLVTLTTAGKKLLRRVVELHDRLECDLIERLGARETEQLIRLLKKFRHLATAPVLSDTD
jgi:DNA-binding MarR family transcriptional regulator